MFQKIKAFLVGLLLTGLGDVETVLAGALHTLPLSDYALDALYYLVPLALALCHFLGLGPGLLAAAIATVVVLLLNGLKLLLHLKF